MGLPRPLTPLRLRAQSSPWMDFTRSGTKIKKEGTHAGATLVVRHFGDSQSAFLPPPPASHVHLNSAL